MSNKKQKKNIHKQQNKFDKTQSSFDQQAMTEAIVQAFQIIEEQKKNKELELQKAANQEWKDIMGQKIYPEDEKWYLKKLHLLQNNVVGLGKVFFFKENNARDLKATFSLIKLVVCDIFKVCEWCLYAAAIYVICLCFKNHTHIIWRILMAFANWMLGRFFRIATFEVENLEDGNLLIGLFSGCISVIALIISIISIFIK